MSLQKMHRAPFALANLIMSLAILTIGVGTAVASGYWNLDRFFNNPGTLRNFADSFFVAMMIVGLSCIVISLLGCATYKIKSRALPACYGGFLIPIWIIFVVLASILGQILRPGTVQGFSQFCNASQTQSPVITNMFKNYVTDIDTILVPLASKWMCSQQCPCDSAFGAPWTSMSESDLQLKQRTKNATDTNDLDGTVGLSFITPNVNNVVYSTFANCFYEWKADWEDPEQSNSVYFQTPAGWQSSAQSDFQTINSVFNTIEMTQTFQNDLGCNGVCKQGLFGFSSNIELGIPKTTCSDLVQKSFSSIAPFVYNWLVAGSVITLVAWLTQLPLLLTFNKARPNYDKLQN